MKSTPTSTTEKNTKPLKKKPAQNILLGQAIAMTIAGIAAGMVVQYLITKTQNDSKKAETNKRAN